MACNNFKLNIHWYNFSLEENCVVVGQRDGPSRCISNSVARPQLNGDQRGAKRNKRR
jgi:hypothetical protein